ncbi:hypothetical protein NG783_09845 [Aliarcobacter cryaerophilus]|uniref:hypothetical protein n=1 Tax=Aliarcobacter cryaerophilus TaxID=28198 RepID=UPI003DA57BF8
MKKKGLVLGISLSLLSSNLNADMVRNVLDKIVVNSSSSSSQIDTIKDNIAEQILKISMNEEDKKFVHKKWDDLFEKIEEAEKIRNEIETAPATALFGSDKISLKKDLDEQLSEILFMITENKSALKFIKEIRAIKQNIQVQKDNITNYREKMMFPLDESQKEDYQNKIDKANKTISVLETKIQISKESLMYNLSTAGVIFTSEQLDMLITRVDVDDILQLTLVFNNLKIVTEQLGKLMEATKDDIKATKKYYAMYVILSEMIVYTQKQYLNKMDNIYLPKISKIVNDAEAIQTKTKMLINSTKDAKSKKILDSNYKSQVLSAKTASLYRKQLNQQQSKIKNALNQSTHDLQIALNTFKTVQISFTLLEVIKESRESFNSLLNIQLPELIPFENKEMALEYEKITKEISN